MAKTGRIFRLVFIDTLSMNGIGLINEQGE